MSLCARICSLLCCGRTNEAPIEPRPESPLAARMDLVARAHIITDEGGIITHIHADFHLERLKGSLLSAYIRGAGASMGQDPEMAIELPGLATASFYQRDISIEGRIFSIFNRVIPLSKEYIPNDEIRHLAGNMLSISSDTDSDPKGVIQKLAISTQIIYCKSHLATLREQESLEIANLSSQELQAMLISLLTQGSETVLGLKQTLDINLPHACITKTHKESLTYLIKEAYYLLMDRLKEDETFYCLVTPSLRGDRFYVYMSNSLPGSDLKEDALAYLSMEVAGEEIITPKTLSNSLSSQLFISGEDRNFKQLNIFPRIRESGSHAVTFSFPCSYDKESSEEKAHISFEHAISSVEMTPVRASPLEMTGYSTPTHPKPEGGTIRISPSRIAQVHATQPEGSRVSLVSITPTIVNKALLRVLVVDDERANRMLAKRTITKLSPATEVIEADDGTTAVDSPCMKDRSMKPDAIFMDMRMKVMNGDEASRRIHEIYPDVPIYPMTANTTQDDLRTYREAGMVADLTISKGSTLAAGISAALADATVRLNSPVRAGAGGAGAGVFASSDTPS